MRRPVLLSILGSLALLALVLFFAGRGRGGGASVPTPAHDQERDPVLETGLSAADAEGLEPAAGAAPGRDERVVAAADATGPRRPIAGVLVDAATGAPLPEAQVVLRVAGHPQRPLLTDAQGRFATRSPRAPGLVRAAIANAPGETARWNSRHRHSETSDPWRIELHVGPTYLVDLEVPGELPLGELEVYLNTGGSFGLGNWPRTFLREGRTPWIRFDAPVETRPGDPQPRLEVRDREGLWIGSAPVESAARVPPQLVHITLTPSGATARGRVLDSNGEPYTTARVMLLSTDGLRTPRDQARVGRFGEFSFMNLEARRVTLVVQAPDQRALELEVQLLPGENVVEDFVFPAPLEPATIAGCVRPLGPEKPHGWLVLRSATGLPVHRVHPVRTNWDPKEGVYWFAFDGLPPGAYELELVATSGQTFAPVRQRVDAPSEGIEIACRTEAALRQLFFEPVDAVTGEPVLDFAVTGGSASYWPYDLASLGPNYAWRVYAEDGPPLDWIVIADGYRPCPGSLADFDPVDGVARPRLQPGAGVVLFFVDARWLEGFPPVASLDPVLIAEAPPVAGVEVRVQGKSVARSNALGIAVVSLEGGPLDIELEHRAWTRGPQPLVLRADAGVELVPLRRNP